MKKYFSTTGPHVQQLVIRLMLVGLLFSSSVAAGNPANLRAAGTGPGSVGVASALRSYALTTVPGQRISPDTSKQNSVKHPVHHGGLPPRESGVAISPVRHPLVKTDRSVLYLSFRLSRPGGRAPPASA